MRSGSPPAAAHLHECSQLVHADLLIREPREVINVGLPRVLANLQRRIVQNLNQVLVRAAPAMQGSSCVRHWRGREGSNTLERTGSCEPLQSRRRPQKTVPVLHQHSERLERQRFELTLKRSSMGNGAVTSAKNGLSPSTQLPVQTRRAPACGVVELDSWL